MKLPLREHSFLNAAVRVGKPLYCLYRLAFASAMFVASLLQPRIVGSAPADPTVQIEAIGVLLDSRRDDRGAIFVGPMKPWYKDGGPERWQTDVQAEWRGDKVGLTTRSRRGWDLKSTTRTYEITGAVATLIWPPPEDGFILCNAFIWSYVRAREGVGSIGRWDAKGLAIEINTPSHDWYVRRYGDFWATVGIIWVVPDAFDRATGKCPLRPLPWAGIDIGPAHGGGVLSSLFWTNYWWTCGRHRFGLKEANERPNGLPFCVQPDNPN
jgi:hypothetical protein